MKNHKAASVPVCRGLVQQGRKGPKKFEFKPLFQLSAADLGTQALDVGQRLRLPMLAGVFGEVEILALAH